MVLLPASGSNFVALALREKETLYGCQISPRCVPECVSDVVKPTIFKIGFLLRLDATSHADDRRILNEWNAQRVRVFIIHPIKDRICYPGYRFCMSETGETFCPCTGPTASRIC